MSLAAPSGQRRVSRRTAAKTMRPMRKPTSLAAVSFQACPSPRPLARRMLISKSSARPFDDSFKSAAPVICGGRTRYLNRPLSTVLIHLLTSSSDHSQIGIDAAKSTKGKSTEHSARKVDNAADICVTCRREFVECNRSVAVGDTVERMMVLCSGSVKHERNTWVSRLARYGARAVRWRAMRAWARKQSFSAIKDLLISAKSRCCCAVM
mmetsp:Transcript_83028/g.199261  ORF Transcript_83028/g.199261 Transcript_83028/m.199261 type:complete len:209 (+) Transcript_83028:235-861(+)